MEGKGKEKNPPQVNGLQEQEKKKKSHIQVAKPGRCSQVVKLDHGESTLRYYNETQQATAAGVLLLLQIQEKLQANQIREINNFKEKIQH